MANQSFLSKTIFQSILQSSLKLETLVIYNSICNVGGFAKYQTPAHAVVTVAALVALTPTDPHCLFPALIHQVPIGIHRLQVNVSIQGTPISQPKSG